MKNILLLLVKVLLILWLVVIIFITIIIVDFLSLGYDTYKPMGRLMTSIRENNITEFETALERCSKRDINSLQYRSKIMVHIAEAENLYPLELACEQGNFDMVKRLIERGADVNMVNPQYHTTPLIMATRGVGNDAYKISMFLIEQGADINAAGKGYTPLSNVAHMVYSQESEKEEYIRSGMELFVYLVENCDTLEVRPHSHTNILECTTSFDNLPAVKYLIENHYFEMNDFSENGMTILHFAVKKDSINVCKYLLEQGANQNILDAEGKTAYDYALENGSEDMIALFNN